MVTAHWHINYKYLWILQKVSSYAKGSVVTFRVIKLNGAGIDLWGNISLFEIIGKLFWWGLNRMKPRSKASYRLAPIQLITICYIRTHTFLADRLIDFFIVNNLWVINYTLLSHTFLIFILSLLRFMHMDIIDQLDG